MKCVHQFWGYILDASTHSYYYLHQPLATINNMRKIRIFDHTIFKKVLFREVSPWVILVAATVLWKSYYAYWTPVVRHYLVPPGDDAAFHIGRVADAMGGKIALFTPSGYPLGFHNIVALIAVLFHQSALTTIIWVGPSLMVLPIIAIYFAGKKMFASAEVGAIAAAAWGVLALAPVRAFGDGNYPNLLAGSVFLPLAVAALYHMIAHGRTKKRIASVVVLSLAIALTHHLSFIYFIVATVPWLIFATIDNLTHPHTRHATLRYLKIFTTMCLALCLVLVLIFGRFLAPYLHALLRDGNLATVFGSESKPLDIIAFMEIHNPFFVIWGLVGLLVVMLSKLNRSLKLLLATWTLALLALSLTPIFGLPGRFAREAAVPFAFSIGYMMHFISEFLRPMRLHFVVPISVVSILVASTMFAMYRPFALPDPFLPLIRVQNSEEQAFILLDQLTPSGTAILTNNSNPFIHYLVHRPVYVIDSDYNVAAFLEKYPISTVYLGPKPALSDGYPYYANYDLITSAMGRQPSFKLVKRLDSGSRIFLYDRPK